MNDLCFVAASGPALPSLSTWSVNSLRLAWPEAVLTVTRNFMSAICLLPLFCPYVFQRFINHVQRRNPISPCPVLLRGLPRKHLTDDPRLHRERRDVHAIPVPGSKLEFRETGDFLRQQAVCALALVLSRLVPMFLRPQQGVPIIRVEAEEPRQFFRKFD